MNATPFNALSVFAVVPVKNLDVSIQWYEKVFGRAPDHRPAPNVAEYYLAEDRDPRKGTLQLMIDENRAGGGLATINVTSIERIVTALKEQGISIDTVTFPINADEASSVTIGTITDPDGNALTIVQPS